MQFTGRVFSLHLGRISGFLCEQEVQKAQTGRHETLGWFFFLHVLWMASLLPFQNNFGWLTIYSNLYPVYFLFFTDVEKMGIWTVLTNIVIYIHIYTYPTQTLANLRWICHDSLPGSTIAGPRLTGVLETCGTMPIATGSSHMPWSWCHIYHQEIPQF